MRLVPWCQDVGPILFEQSDEEASDIWVVSANGGPPRNVTRTPTVEERQPAWAPDMRRIAYVREDEMGRGTVIVSRADGTARAPTRRQRY